MDPSNILIPVFIKYDFITEYHENKSQKEWIECRLNVQPSRDSDRDIQIFCYPSDYNELLPYFVLSIDYAALRCGSVSSRSKSNTYGLFWQFASKDCRILIAFSEKDSRKRYAKYLKNMLTTFRSQHEFENNCLSREKIQPSDEEFQPISEEMFEIQPQLMEVIRVSDASGQLHDVVLRPKSQKGRRLARPLAVISNLFKFNRSSQVEKSRPQSQYREKVSQIMSIFKRKSTVEDEDAPTFHHFQQPMNVERCSDVMMPGSVRNLEWYDLNQGEMEAIEGRVTDILNHLNSGTKMTENDIETMCNLDFLRRLTISSNILWSHNLTSSNLNVDNVSEVNLLGANLHEEQIRSEVFIEDDTLTTSMESVDSDGYTVMQPIAKEIPSNQSIVIDDITKELDFTCRRENRLSFSFDDNQDECSPFQRLKYKPKYAKKSPATVSDVTACETLSVESICSPHSEKPVKKSLRAMIKPRKLLRLLSSSSISETSTDDSQHSSNVLNRTSTLKGKYRKHRKPTSMKRNIVNRFSFVDNRKCVETPERTDEYFDDVFVQNFFGSNETKKVNNSDLTPTSPGRDTTFGQESPNAKKFERHPSIVKRIKNVFTIKKSMYI